MKSKPIALTLAIFMTSNSLTHQSPACSRAVYLGTEDTIITVRSMDWATDLGSNLWALARGM